MTTRTYRLPFPPSINTYWRTRVAGKRAITYLSPAAKKFRDDVFHAMFVATETPGTKRFEQRPLHGRLAVNIELTAPNRRKFDVDNRIKAVLDALQHSLVFIDDEQIDELRVKRLHVESPGCCDVTIVEIGEPTC